MSQPSPNFVRRPSAPTTKRLDYRVFREPVREDFRKTCAYCLLEETWAAGPENFELDHFRPKSLFPRLMMSYYKSSHRIPFPYHKTKPLELPTPNGDGGLSDALANLISHFLDP